MDYWPHSPPHMVYGPGAYFVTASTLHKQRLFNSGEKLDYLERELLHLLAEHKWRLQAWAIFANHYHFVGLASENPNITKLLNQLHGRTSRWLNQEDGVSGRQVWFQFRDTALTFEKSYLARLSYVHRNAVKHGIVKFPEEYKWCSARWFMQHATDAQIKLIMELPIDKVEIEDDF